MSDQTNINQDDLKDWFLMHFIRSADKYGAEMGVTLNVGGTIVSGTLVSGADYFVGFSEELASAFPKKSDADIIRSSFSKNADLHPRVKYDDDGNEIEDEIHDRDHHYIHLKDARFIMNGQQSLPTIRGVWCRGKISSIDGFNLGSIRVE